MKPDDDLANLDDIADQLTAKVNVGHVRHNIGSGAGWPRMVKKMSKLPMWKRQLLSIKRGAARRKKYSK